MVSRPAAPKGGRVECMQLVGKKLMKSASLIQHVARTSVVASGLRVRVRRHMEPPGPPKRTSRRRQAVDGVVGDLAGRVVCTSENDR